MGNEKNDKSLNYSFYFLMFLVTISVLVFIGYIVYGLLFA